MIYYQVEYIPKSYIFCFSKYFQSILVFNDKNISLFNNIKINH